MNNFPAMTEAQRQRLTGFIAAAFASMNGDERLSTGYEAEMEALTKQVFEIALAALTAPPAPVLKPIELKRGALMISFYSTDPMNEDPVLCLSRDGVIEAIRTAGYEVKE